MLNSMFELQQERTNELCSSKYTLGSLINVYMWIKA